MALHPGPEFFARTVTRSYGENLSLRFVDGRVQLETVEHQQSFHRGVTYTLVPVDERMVFDERKTQGRCLRPEARIKVLAPKALLGLAESGFEETKVSEAVGPTSLRDDQLMQPEDLSQAEVPCQRRRS